MKKLSIVLMIFSFTFMLLLCKPLEFSATNVSASGVSIETGVFNLIGRTLSETSRNIPFDISAHFVSSYYHDIPDMDEYVRDIQSENHFFDNRITLIVDVDTNYAAILFSESNPDLSGINFGKVENIFMAEHESDKERFFAGIGALAREIHRYNEHGKTERLVRLLAILDDPESIELYIDLILVTLSLIFEDEEDQEVILYSFTQSLKPIWPFEELPELSERHVSMILEGVWGETYTSQTSARSLYVGIGVVIIAALSFHLASYFKKVIAKGKRL